MSVKELIDKLKNFNQELTVKVFVEMNDDVTLLGLDKIYVDCDEQGDRILVLN
jgi:hypothetical protein